MFWGKNLHKFQNHKTAREKKRKKKKRKRKESNDLRQCLNFVNDGVISQLTEFRFRK
jgi:thiamine pyrophosphokinase